MPLTRGSCQNLVLTSRPCELHRRVWSPHWSISAPHLGQWGCGSVLYVGSRSRRVMATVNCEFVRMSCGLHGVHVKVCVSPPADKSCALWRSSRVEWRAVFSWAWYGCMRSCWRWFMDAACVRSFRRQSCWAAWGRLWKAVENWFARVPKGVAFVGVGLGWGAKGSAFFRCGKSGGRCLATCRYLEM
jgi:hypothetical protein